VAHAGSPRFFTLLLITINVAIFVMMAAVDSRTGGHEGSFIGPASIPVLLDFGSRLSSLIASGQWWRLVTPIFIHLGLIHLLFNNFALFQIGPLIEESLGSQKFILVYVGSGIVGNIGSYIFQIPGAGASGAIFGLIALAAVYGYRMGGVLGRTLMRQMVTWAAIGLILGQTVLHADNVNHIGGLITGAALGFTLTLEHPRTARSTLLWNTAAILSMALIAISFAMVALHYGNIQHGEDVTRLSASVRKMDLALRESLQWQSGSGRDPHDIASSLRSAAGDIARIPRIDGRSDSIRQRIVDVASRRATLFDSADKDLASVLKAQAQTDSNEIDADFDAYHEWESSILADYGLEYQSTGDR
jgi:membrane associated rhomboid family serine protease